MYRQDRRTRVPLGGGTPRRPATGSGPRPRTSRPRRRPRTSRPSRTCTCPGRAAPAVSRRARSAVSTEFPGRRDSSPRIIRVAAASPPRRRRVAAAASPRRRRRVAARTRPLFVAASRVVRPVALARLGALDQRAPARPDPRALLDRVLALVARAVDHREDALGNFDLFLRRRRGEDFLVAVRGRRVVGHRCYGWWRVRRPTCCRGSPLGQPRAAPCCGTLRGETRPSYRAGASRAERTSRAEVWWGFWDFAPARRVVRTMRGVAGVVATSCSRRVLGAAWVFPGVPEHGLPSKNKCTNNCSRKSQRFWLGESTKSSHTSTFLGWEAGPKVRRGGPARGLI